MTITNKSGVETKIFAKTFEEEAYKQIEELCNFSPYLNEKIRIMPDAHAGKGCTVGTTMTITDKVTPNLVGVDIGCGMSWVEIVGGNIDVVKLDQIIRDNVPSGFSVHEESVAQFDFSGLRCKKHVDINRAMRSIGTLGGGNHFIEVDIDSDGTPYLIVHSGSRNIGVGVCKYYQNLAAGSMSVADGRDSLIERLKSCGRENEISAELKKLYRPSVNTELAYLEGESFGDYIHDMEIIQRYASFNRGVILDIIIRELLPDYEIPAYSETIHNYIDTESMILRKGAVSAKMDELLLIPINMRDGSLLCYGKGNPDWNYSAPHGAGRIMSRKKAKELLSMGDYTESMSGIYTTSVSEQTLDEAPLAYKPIDEIVDSIADTVRIWKKLKPIYNFKAN